MKLTADTITDGQIRGLRTWAMQNARYDVAARCVEALKSRTRPKSVRLEARARCAEILNACMEHP